MTSPANALSAPPLALAEGPGAVDGAAGAWVDYAGDRPSVRVVGPVRRDTITELSGSIRGLLAAGVRELTVDLTGARDGTGALLRVLARTRAHLVDQDGGLRVVGVLLPEFLAALRDAPLDEVFLVYDAIRHDTDAGRPGRVVPPSEADVPLSRSAQSGRHHRVVAVPALTGAEDGAS